MKVNTRSLSQFLIVIRTDNFFLNNNLFGYEMCHLNTLLSRRVFIDFDTSLHHNWITMYKQRKKCVRNTSNKAEAKRLWYCIYHIKIWKSKLRGNQMNDIFWSLWPSLASISSLYNNRIKLFHSGLSGNWPRSLSRRVF